MFHCIGTIENVRKSAGLYHLKIINKNLPATLKVFDFTQSIPCPWR